MTPVQDYCRQYHFIDIAMFGRCQMCHGIGLMAGHEEERDVTEKEARQAEKDSHLHP